MERIGRYKIVRELGRGAMGVVYHAIDPNIGRPVAIKTIQLGNVRNSGEQERLRERLFREARSAGILSHPSIVTIYDVDQQDELAFIAMEYVDGPTLDQLLSAPRPMDPERMFRILAQTAAALDYAHQKGIVHRDIKPANIMIAADGTAKITDFGIAKITTAEQLTMTGSIVGTPHYMSPEQVQGQPVDGRSDQFSLAVIAFEMMTGDKPYTGEHLTTVVYKIVAEEPAPPHTLNATLAGPIEDTLCKGLAKKPGERYATCQEFIGSLEKACASSPGWRPLARGGTLNEPTLAGSPRPAVSLPPARRPRREDATGTGTNLRSEHAKLGFLPFLAAILMAAALLALIGWQAGVPSWLTWGGRGGAAANRVPAPQGPPAAANSKPAVPQEPAPPSSAPATAAESKPSPMSPAPSPAAAEETKPAQEPAKPLDSATESPVTATVPPPAPVPARRTIPAVAPEPEEVTVISSPAGATATLDGRAEAACSTPCSLQAAPGRHTIAITIPGYQVEHREVDVGPGPVELPVVILHAGRGTLLIVSSPAGAAITINGKRMPQTTPAQIPLPPGSYRVQVEKDGAQSSSALEIHSGETKVLKVSLGR
ncbi:MAG: serine/threonine-protein kinase [Bryobacteraceae bacterium]|jgi:serine/threonine-protein kinase